MLSCECLIVRFYDLIFRPEEGTGRPENLTYILSVSLVIFSALYIIFLTCIYVHRSDTLGYIVLLVLVLYIYIYYMDYS